MSSGIKEIYEFGRFRLDAAELVLLRDGQPVPLPPKVLETLRLLVRHSGHIVTKEELMRELWADTFVEESNIPQNIFTLRKTLGEESGEKKYIETVPRRGYRFAAEVRPVAVEEDIELLLRSRTRTHIVSESEFSTSELIRVQNAAEQPMLQQESSASSLAARTQAAIAPTRSQKTLLIGIAILISALLVAGFLLLQLFNRTQTSPLSIEIKRLTTDSKAFDPALSPDGKNLAYRVRDNDHESIWIKNIATGSAVQILPSLANGYSSLVFSPDGNYLFYKTNRQGSPNGVVCRVPIFGGVPQEIAKDVWSYVSVSPDSKQIAFIREKQLLVANVDGSGERELIKSIRGERWFEPWGLPPSWSADGQKVAIYAYKRDETGDHGCLLEIQVNDATVKEISSPRWQNIFQAVWLADGKGLIVVARETDNAPHQVWHLAYPGGEARRLTHDLHNYSMVSLTADSRLLAVQQGMHVSHLWLLPDGDASRAKQLTFGTNDSDGFYGVDWTPDGRIVFASNRGDNYDIWMMDADGSNVKPLTTNAGGSNRLPRVSPDGRYIVFASNRDDREHIWRINADGKSPMRLTDGDVVHMPCISPDGLWVYYTELATWPVSLRRVSIDGGEAFPVPNLSSSFSPVVSPDGKLIAYTHYSEESGWKIGILPIAGGEPLKLFKALAFNDVIRWTADSQAFIYIKPEGYTVSNLWKQPLNGGAAQPITNFKDDRIFNFAYARDNKNLVIARGNYYSDIVLITNFKESGK